jgi:putative component of toxin-antitoxin plasmid stabilization module
VLLLCGGDKSIQRADIAGAQGIVATETDDAD